MIPFNGQIKRQDPSHQVSCHVVRCASQEQSAVFQGLHYCLDEIRALLPVLLQSLSFDDPDISIVHLPSHTNRFHPCIDSFGQLHHTDDIAKGD